PALSPPTPPIRRSRSTSATSWSSAWWSASSGNTSRAAQTLEGVATLAGVDDLSGPRHAVGIRRDQPGDVDRRACVEQQSGQSGQVLAPVAEQALDTRCVDRGFRARKPGHVVDRESVA